MPKDLPKPNRAPSSPRFFEPPSEPEFAWPPRAEDLEACAIVPLEGEHAGEVLPFELPPVEVEPVFVELSAVLAPAKPQSKARSLRARFTRTNAPLTLPLAVEDVEPPASARSAWLAVFVAAACVVIAYTQFRIEWTRGGVPTVVLKSAPEGESAPILEAAPDPPAPVALIPASRPRASDVRREPIQPALVAEDARAATDPMPSASLEAQPVAASLPAPIVTAAYVEPPRLEPSRLDPPRPEPAAVLPPEPIATRVAEAPVANEEDGIRTTLTRWRTAYSELNASAAQEVWPSVDVRALRTAFRGIKSQELHFDRCQLTVTGARAQAACSGRAVYVPGVGDRSPRTAPREWKFDLLKADDRWTIASASARAS